MSTILGEVATYYSDKLATHGETPRGVDWNGEESQKLRFEQLTKIVDRSPYSLNDVGCGYGALIEHLDTKGVPFSYLGVDVSADMVKAGEERYRSRADARFLVGSEPDAVADFGIASGIFNVRLGRSDEEWLAYIDATIDVLARTSRHGFAFNCLTSYSDEDKKRDYLYYADPCRFFDRCKRLYSRNVALLHDYGLYEFTLLVRKLG